MSQIKDWLVWLCDWLNYSEQGFIAKMVVLYAIVGAVFSGIERSMVAKKHGEIEDESCAYLLTILTAATWPIGVIMDTIKSVSDYAKNICDNARERKSMKSSAANPNTDDIVLVVRCKHCKWRSKYNTRCCARTMPIFDEDGFCSYGEQEKDEASK